MSAHKKKDEKCKVYIDVLIIKNKINQVQSYNLKINKLASINCLTSSNIKNLFPLEKLSGFFTLRSGLSNGAKISDCRLQTRTMISLSFSQ